MVAPAQQPPESLLAERQAAVARRLDGTAALVVAAGTPVPIPGGHDQCWPFRPHPRYQWLAGAQRPGAIMTWCPSEGWNHFVPPETVGERLWAGGGSVPDGRPLDAFDAWIQSCRDLPIASIGTSVAGLRSSAVSAAAAADTIDATRRVKDAWEIARMRAAVSMTADAFDVARAVARPGVTEREIRIRLESEAFLKGATSMGYETIVGAGARAAILHGNPGFTRLERGDFVLVDAGACVDGYTADVTRTWVCGGSPDTRRRDLLHLVAGALRVASAACVAGTEWHDVHRAAAHHMAEGLRGLGILRGTPQDRCEDGSIGVFFPHGIGHLVGLGVRDAGGVAPGRATQRSCCGAYPRIDLPLEPGFIVTVEPGLYFVDALLDDPTTRERYAESIDWQAVEAWRGIGGVRLEDNLLVLPTGAPENLTAEIPLYTGSVA